MTIRTVFLFAGVVIALSGCASTDGATSDATPSFKNAVYVPANSTASVQTADAAASASDQLMPGQSKPMRIYWFLGGR